MREGESEVGFVDVLSGRELHRLGAAWLGTDVETATALAACRAEHSRGRVASAESARDAGVGQNRGRGRRFRTRRDAWRRRRAGGVQRRRRQGTQGGGDDGEGRLIINSKFQSSVCKFSFSPCSRGQTKTFEYKSCSKLQILQLSFHSQIHLKLNLKDKI